MHGYQKCCGDLAELTLDDIIIIIIIKPRLTRHMSVTKEDESQVRGHEIVYG